MVCILHCSWFRVLIKMKLSPHIKYNLKTEHFLWNLPLYINWMAKFLFLSLHHKVKLPLTAVFFFFFLSHSPGSSHEILPDIQWVCFSHSSVSKAIKKTHWFLTILISYLANSLHREWMSNIQQIHFSLSGFQIWNG